MTEAVDFTKVNSKAYRVWRILQGPGPWAQIYRDRERRFRDVQGAMIFPEQLLGLNQASIFKVVVVPGSNSVMTTIQSYRNYQLGGVTVDGFDNTLYSRQEIFDHEEAATVKPMIVGGLGVSSEGRSFHDHAWFTSAMAAHKFQQREQKALLSQLG